MGAWSPLVPEPDLAVARALCERLHVEAAMPQSDLATACPTSAEEACGFHQDAAQLQGLLDQLAEQLHAARLVQDLPRCIARCCPHCTLFLGKPSARVASLGTAACCYF